MTDTRNSIESRLATTDCSLGTLVTNNGLKAALWAPLYLPRSAWLEHIPFAFWLIACHRPRTLVELGTHHGASYFAFCQAVEALSLDTRCYSVDTWTGDEHAGYYGEEVYASVKAHNHALYSRFSTLIRAPFSETVAYFDDSSIDLLHIDGLHTQDAVQQDVENWMPKLSSRSILLMHDTNVRERNFGVAKVFSWLRQSYPGFEFAYGHGLGVVGIGPDISSELAELFAAEPNSTLRRDISNLFATLGRACSDAFEAGQAAKKRT